MTHKIKKFIPVGIKPETELWIYGSGIALSVLSSLFYFVTYYGSYNAMFNYYGNKKVLIEGASMPDFWSLIDGGVFDVFKIWIFAFLAMIAVHYGYHYRESKSIYTMRRLPNKYELHIRCTALPLSATAVSLILSFILLIIYYVHYMTVTPDELLLPSQWEKLMDYIIHGGIA